MVPGIFPASSSKLSKTPFNPAIGEPPFSIIPERDHPVTVFQATMPNVIVNAWSDCHGETRLRITSQKDFLRTPRDEAQNYDFGSLVINALNAQAYVLARK